VTAQPAALYVIPAGKGRELAELIDRTTCLLAELADDLAAERTEHARTRNRLALLRADHSRLLSAARATVAADQDHDPDPVLYLRGLLEDTGQAPAPGMHAPGVLAAARDNLALAGWLPASGPAAVTPAVTNPPAPLSEPHVRGRCQGPDRGNPAIVTPRPPAALSGAPGRPGAARPGIAPAGIGTSQERTYADE
jgi:hypothetical protein